MTMPGRQPNESPMDYGRRMAGVMVGLAEVDRTQRLAENIKSRHGPLGGDMRNARRCVCGGSWPCDTMALAECVASLAWSLNAAGENRDR